MRVLHVITGLHAGGAEQQLASLLEHTRHDADVVTMYAPGIIADRLVARGVAVHNLDRPHQLDLRALPELVRLMRRGAYDVVHTHLYRACLYGRVAARVAGIHTIVATEHSLGDTQIEGRGTTPAVRQIYLAGERCGHHTIAVSEAARRRLLAWGVEAGRISVIPNGLDVERYTFSVPARRHERALLGIADDEAVIGTVGRLHPIKRHDLLLECGAPLLRDARARMLIVGMGEQDAALREQARRLGIADRVHFVGERGDIPALLSAMDVFAAPSTEETFGLAVIEALCAGLPAVVGACPAIDGLELADVVRCNDAPTLQAGLRMLLDRVHRSPSASRQPPASITDHMDIQQVAAAVDNLYQDVGISSHAGGSRDTYAGRRR